MKKTLVALAIASAFTGAAFAQSSVTVYGIADVGYQFDDYDRSGAASLSGVQAGIRNGNRLGFRGSEDLGGGLRAIFQLETGFNLDSGSLGQGGRIFGRQAYAGVAGNWGTLVAGRMATYGSGTGAFDMVSDLDPFYSGYGLAGAQNTFIEINSLRIDNAINYRTPNIGGFQAGWMHSFGAGSAPTAEVAGISNNLRVDSLGMSYGAGPFYGAVTYLRAEFPSSANVSDMKVLQVGASWDFKMFKLMALYDDDEGLRGTVISPFPVNLDGIGGKSWVVGGHVPFGPLGSKFIASYQQRNAEATVVAGTTIDAGRKIWGLGYEYHLSRRTFLHAYFADSSGDDFLRAGTALTDFANRKQYSLGMTHFF